MLNLLDIHESYWLSCPCLLADKTHVQSRACFLRKGELLLIITLNYITLVTVCFVTALLFWNAAPG